MDRVSPSPKTSDVGSDDRAAGVVRAFASVSPRSTLARSAAGPEKLSRRCTPGVSKVETVTPPDPAYRFARSVTAGSSGLPIASTRPFELVAKASTASKIDFGTPATVDQDQWVQRMSFPGRPIDRDQPACGRRRRVPFRPAPCATHHRAVTRPGRLPLRCSRPMNATESRGPAWSSGIVVANGSPLSSQPPPHCARGSVAFRCRARS